MKRTILVLFLLLLAAVLLANRSESIFGADSSGYINLARMLSEGKVTRALPVACDACQPSWVTPLGFVPVGDGMASFYPVGLPLHLALAALAGGWAHAPFVVSPIAAVVLVFLTWWLGRRLHSDAAGLIAALLMGMCAVFIFQALQPMSDVVAATWSVATIAAAVKSRERTRFSILAGFCFGIAVLVRPTSLLLLPALAFALPLRWRALAGFIAGGIPAAIVLGWYNLAAFGSLLATGYSVGGATRELALEYFPPRAWHYLRWTAEQFSPLAVIAAIGGLWALQRRDRLMLAVWFVAFFVFYSFYFSYDAWWYTRFLLPAYPALAIAAGVALAHVMAMPRLRIAATMLVMVMLAWEARQIARFGVLYTDEDQHRARVPAEFAARALPTGTLVFAKEFSGSLVYYSALRPVRWDLAPPEFRSPAYALLMPHEEEPFRMRHGERFRRVRTFDGGALFFAPR